MQGNPHVEIDELVAPATTKNDGTAFVERRPMQALLDAKLLERLIAEATEPEDGRIEFRTRTMVAMQNALYAQLLRLHSLITG